MGSLVSGFSPRSAALRLLKVESDINGILPAGGGPLHIYFVSLLIRLRSALGGNGILRSTALRSFLAAAVNLQKLLGLCSEREPGQVTDQFFLFSPIVQFWQSDSQGS